MTRRTRSSTHLASAATATAAAGAGLLLRRMRSELLGQGKFARPTAAAMYALYGAHAFAVAAATRNRTLPVPAPRRAAFAAGAPLVVAGTAAFAAGVRRFAGPGQVTGTQAGDLVTGGAYKYSRNPQYTGYVLALTGIGVARRSGGVLALAAATAAVYRWWVPVEETALRHTFGEPYEQYAETAPRWLGPRGRA